MPPAAAAGVGVAIGAAASATAVTISVTTIAIQLAVGLALSLVGRLLAPKPSSQQAPVGNTDTGTEISVREPVAPRQIIYGRTRVGGRLTFIHTTDSNNYLHLVVTLAGHECEEIESLWFDDEIVPLDGAGAATGKYAGFVWAYKKRGAAGEAAFPELVAVSGGTWTEHHRQDGCASIYVRLKWNRDKFPQGMPGIRCTVKGKKVYDPRTDTTAWSDNAALCLADYIADATFGPGAEYGTEIDEDYLSAAANICDETAGSSSARYTCNGAFLSESKPIDVIPRLLGAMAGRLNYSGGLWLIRAGAYVVPEITLDEDDLRGPMTIQSLLSRRENFNAVKGKYVAETNAWQPTDFPAVISATYQEEDGGERVYDDIDLPFTSSSAAAQRMARAHLRAARQPITVRYPCGLRGYALLVGDTVSINNTRMGWSPKVFEVVDMKMALGDESGRIGVDLTLRETAESIFDWSANDEVESDPAPNTTLPNVFDVVPPISLTVDEELYDTRSASGVKARASLRWGGSPDAFVVAYRPAYRLVGATEWIPIAWTDGTTAFVEDIAPGVYEFNVAAVNLRDVVSDAIVVVKEIVGLAAPPGEPQNLTVSAIGGMAVLRWDQSADLDVRIGGSIVFRHVAAMAGATWDAGTGIGEPQPGLTTAAVLPLKAGTYLAKFRDSAGVWSADAGMVVTAQSSIHDFTPLASVVEDPSFAGTHDTTGVDGGLLFLGADYDFDSVPDVDALGDWDFNGGVAGEGTYLFANAINLGAVTRCRLTSAVISQVVSVLDTMDLWTGDVDDRPNWDGDITGDEADARVYVRHTNDNPAGTPTWSTWERLDSAEFEARAFQFKAVLMSAEAAYSIRVSDLAVVAEAVV